MCYVFSVLSYGCETWIYCSKSTLLKRGATDEFSRISLTSQTANVDVRQIIDVKEGTMKNNLKTYSCLMRAT